MLVEGFQIRNLRKWNLTFFEISPNLADKDIKHVFATDYKRTNTAMAHSRPSWDAKLEIYDPKDQSFC